MVVNCLRGGRRASLMQGGAWMVLPPGGSGRPEPGRGESTDAAQRALQRIWLSLRCLGFVIRSTGWNLVSILSSRSDVLSLISSHMKNVGLKLVIGDMFMTLDKNPNGINYKRSDDVWDETTGKISAKLLYDLFCYLLGYAERLVFAFVEAAK